MGLDLDIKMRGESNGFNKSIDKFKNYVIKYFF